MRVDRWLNLQDTPAFLRAVQPKERSWWRIALTVLLLLGGFFVAFIAYSAVIGIETVIMPRLNAPLRVEGALPFWGAGLTAEIDRLLRAAGVFGAYALVVPAAAALVNRRPMKSWLTAAPRFRWRMFFIALALYAAIVGAGLVVEGLVSGWPEHPPFLDSRETLTTRFAYLASALLAVPLAALAEEILTRGWLLQLTSALTRNIGVILVINAVVFALLHFDTNPYANIGRFYTGVALSYMVIRLGGLEFAIGVHAANSLVVALFQQSVIQDKAMTPGGWQTLVSDLIITTAGLALTELVVRWTPLRRWTGAEQTLPAVEIEPRGLPASA